eukprot:2457276-Amphidinium_carterae.1
MHFHVLSSNYQDRLSVDHGDLPRMMLARKLSICGFGLESFFALRTPSGASRPLPLHKGLQPCCPAHCSSIAGLGSVRANNVLRFKCAERVVDS